MKANDSGKTTAAKAKTRDLPPKPGTSVNGGLSYQLKDVVLSSYQTGPHGN